MNESNKYLNKLKEIYNPREYEPKNIITKNSIYELCFLIPVYNAEKTLEKCLNSVCNQKTSFKYSIIIVNDGSKDSSSLIIEKYLKKNDNIFYYTQQNQGISCARNTLLSKANGKYISFLDSDDFISDNFVETMLSKAKTEELDYIKSNYVKISLDDKILYKSNYKIEDNIIDMDRYLWGSLIKKELFENVSFPEGYWFEDMIFSFYVLAKVKKSSICTKSLYYYVDVPQSASKIQGKRKNLKNLEQFYLVFYLITYNQKKSMSFNDFQEKIIMHELSVMLMTRTRHLKKQTRKIVYYAACDLINSCDIKYETKSLKIFKNRNFNIWCINAIIKRIINKIG